MSETTNIRSISTMATWPLYDELVLFIRSFFPQKTLVEDTTRLTLIAQVNHKEKRAVQQAITTILQPVKDWVHTICLIMAGSLATIGSRPSN